MDTLQNRIYCQCDKPTEAKCINGINRHPAPLKIPKTRF